MSVFNFNIDDLGIDFDSFKSHEEVFGEAAIDEKMELKNAHLAALSEAKNAGLPAAAIPLADLLETGAGSADFDWAFWESQIKFRASATGQLMTKQQGKSRAQRLEECREKLDKLGQEYLALTEKDTAKFNEKCAALTAKIDTAKTEAAREKAEKALADFEQIGVEMSASRRLKGLQYDKAKIELEQVELEQECTLSETAKSVCKDLFFSRFFKARKELHGAPLEHGTKYEDYCIARYNFAANANLQKNETRITEPIETAAGGAFLTGECDAVQLEKDADGRKILYEFKAPFDPASYGKQAEEYKQIYFWQCQSYCLLYGADEVRLVASLTENDYMNGNEYSHLPIAALHTTFSIQRSTKHINALLSKLSEAHQFTLNFGREFVAQIGQTRSIPAPEID
jgi:uncharacterized protein (DUF1330 family)